MRLETNLLRLGTRVLYTDARGTQYGTVIAHSYGTKRYDLRLDSGEQKQNRDETEFKVIQ